MNAPDILIAAVESTNRARHPTRPNGDTHMNKMPLAIAMEVLQEALAGSEATLIIYPAANRDPVLRVNISGDIPLKIGHESETIDTVTAIYRLQN